jgi:hypothetical protein
MGGVVTWKIIQVDLSNKSTYRVVIFSQCGGLSLSLYLSRPDEVYQGCQSWWTIASK